MVRALGPIKGKKLIDDCKVKQQGIADAALIDKSTVSLIFNKGLILSTNAHYRTDIELYLHSQPGVPEWLEENETRITEIWDQVSNKQQEEQKEQEMLTVEAKRHFRVVTNPFFNDVQKETDIYMSEEHRYAEAAMLDAAMHSGFLALIGEVGSGKSVMRRKVIEQLQRDENVVVIYPRIIDKTRVSASSICDAIVHDISNESPRRTLEAKSRQVERLLLAGTRSSLRYVIIVEEAHDLTTSALKYLKRFHEIEDGYKKLLGIILIAQPELRTNFSSSKSVDMREVIQRIQIAEISGLKDDIREYLKVKFKRLQIDIDKIFDEDALSMITRRLTSGTGREAISVAYPLRVNGMVTRAMNMAVDMGEDKVTADVIESL